MILKLERQEVQCVLPNFELLLRHKGTSEKVRVLLDTRSDTCLLKKSVYKELRMFDTATSTFFRIKGIEGESCPSTVKLEISVMGVPVTCFVLNEIGTLPPYMTKTKTTEDIGLLIGVDCMSKLVKKARFISEKAQIVINLVNGIEVKAGLCE